MMHHAHDPLVTTEWLAEHLADSDIRVVDIRGYVTTRADGPGVEVATYRGAPEEYRAGHVPGAVFVNWTVDIVDLNDPVPAQIAGPERFAQAMVERGIGDQTHVIAVDHMGGQYATRLWWALTYYGHDAVSVLDGGWNRWVEEERPVTTDVSSYPTATFTPVVRAAWRVTAEEVLARCGDPSLQILDARDPGQYHGTRRRGARGGHIPGAVNLPRELFFAERGGFRPLEEIRTILGDRHVDLNCPMLAYCNGGVAATVPLFHLARLGAANLANYDGSWNEWGNRADLPVQS